MEHLMDEAQFDWEVRAVGLIRDAIEVLAAWAAAPSDAQRPWRWAVLLERKGLQGGRVWAWGTAAGELEAREKAQEAALGLLRGLPEEWVKVRGEPL